MAGTDSRRCENRRADGFADPFDAGEIRREKMHQTSVEKHLPPTGMVPILFTNCDLSPDVLQSLTPLSPNHEISEKDPKVFHIQKSQVRIEIVLLEEDGERIASTPVSLTVLRRA